jgi:hypothetical protein
MSETYRKLNKFLNSEQIVTNQDKIFKIVLCIFDIFIDSKYFKDFNYAIDFKLFDDYPDEYEPKFKYLSHNINYMFATDYIDDIIFDIYDDKYVNLCDSFFQTGGYYKKYLKYKNKYLKLKKK